MPNPFDRATKIIEEHGWCQGWALSPEGKVCLVGALKATQEGESFFNHDPNRLNMLSPGDVLECMNHAIIGQRVRSGGPSIGVNWNDDAERNVLQVIDKLREASALWNAEYASRANA